MSASPPGASGSLLGGNQHTERFENPLLSKEGFIASLTLSAVEVAGSTLITLWFECGEMFWGHSFSVTSFDGVRFNDVRVELQG
ncbi:DUF2262 domain-containing protein [Comamonas sp.]|uniref:DUF2262 domain-containing protein n=1 Tax=Comamonas TaxID=283 RepID=UPI00345C5110